MYAIRSYYVSPMVNAPRWKTMSTTSRDSTTVTAAAAHDTKKTQRKVIV